MKTLRNLLAAGALAISALGAPASAETLDEKVDAQATQTVTAPTRMSAKEEAELNALRATVCVRNTQVRSGGLLGIFLDHNYDGKTDISDAHVKAWDAYRKDQKLEDHVRAPWNSGLQGKVDKFERGVDPQFELSWFGTAFAYKVENGYVYFATNWHVAGQDEEENFLFGRMVRQRIDVVNDYDDDFRADDLKLEFVSGIPSADMAVLRAKVEDVERYNTQAATYNERNPKKKAARASIEAFKGKVGDSETLNVGDPVVMYGFPHAATRSRTSGHVTDDYYPQLWPGQWDHDAFMTDATSAPGNSGSAMLRPTSDGQLEWHGQLNAGFRGGDNINFVIGINNYKKLLENPHAVKVQDDVEARVNKLAATAKGGPDQHRLFEDIAQLKIESDGTVRLIVYGDYPYAKNNRIEFIDRPTNKLGTLDAVVVADENGTSQFAAQALPYYFKENSQKLYTALTEMLMLSYARHTNEGVAPRTAYEHEQLKRIDGERKILELKNGMLYQFVTLGLREHARSMREWGTPYEGPKKKKPQSNAGE